MKIENGLRVVKDLADSRKVKPKWLEKEKPRRSKAGHPEEPWKDSRTRSKVQREVRVEVGGV